MKYTLITLSEFSLSGVAFYGDPFTSKPGWDGENEIGKTFKRFEALQHMYPSLNQKEDGFVYEAHIYNTETFENGMLEIFVGSKLSIHPLPVEWLTKDFPSSSYLLFTLNGQEILSDWWHTLDSEILPTLNLKRSHSFIIQRYDERFKGMDSIDESEMEALIPVECI